MDRARVSIGYPTSVSLSLQPLRGTPLKPWLLSLNVQQTQPDSTFKLAAVLIMLGTSTPTGDSNHLHAVAAQR